LNSATKTFNSQDVLVFKGRNKHQKPAQLALYGMYSVRAEASPKRYKNG